MAGVTINNGDWSKIPPTVESVLALGVEADGSTTGEMAEDCGNFSNLGGGTIIVAVGELPVVSYEEMIQACGSDGFSITTRLR